MCRKMMLFAMVFMCVATMIGMGITTADAAPPTGYTFDVNFEDTNNEPTNIGGYRVLISTTPGDFTIDNSLNVRIGVSNDWVNTIPAGNRDPVVAMVPGDYVAGSFYIGYAAVDITGTRIGPVCEVGSVTLPSALSGCPPVTAFTPVY